MVSETFSGAKIALICGDELVVYERDRKPDIPFPGLWDLPGGGREGAETPPQCALREVREEFGLLLRESAIVWSRKYPGGSIARGDTYFFVSPIERDEVASIRFGDEGARWAMMRLAQFLDHDAAVPHLQQRLAEYLASH